MIPLSSVATVRYSSGPEVLDRFNNLPAVKVIGQGAPGFSSGQAIARSRADRAPKCCRADFSFDWGGTSYQEKNRSGAATFSLGLAVVMVFLILAAQYERCRCRCRCCSRCRSARSARSRRSGCAG